MRLNKRISVIIPALNEERVIAQVLQAVPDWVDEIIVVDNGSTDGIVAAARTGGARVLSEPRRGYGQACLAGSAALSAPDIVVFLDGDFSDHPEEMDQLVDPIARGETDMMIRSRVFRMPYGDQGLFLRRDRFEQLGGFLEQPILEDVDLVRRAQRFGKVVTAREAALTSRRRWQRLGVAQTTFIIQLILAGTALGISPGRLRRWYN